MITMAIHLVSCKNHPGCVLFELCEYSALYWVEVAEVVALGVLLSMQVTDI